MMHWPISDFSIDPPKKPAAQAVYLLHGMGYNKDHMMDNVAPIVRAALPDAHIVAVNSGLEWTRHVRENGQLIPMEGYYWFPPPADHLQPRRELQHNLAVQAGRVNAFIDAQNEALGTAPDQTIIIGFSQGGTVGLTAALLRPRPVQAVVNLSGMFFDIFSPDKSDPTLPPLPIASRPPTLLVYGSADNIIPQKGFDHALWTARKHRLPGYDLKRMGMRHEIDLTTERALWAFLGGDQLASGPARMTEQLDTKTFTRIKRTEADFSPAFDFGAIDRRCSRARLVTFAMLAKAYALTGEKTLTTLAAERNAPMPAPTPQLFVAPPRTLTRRHQRAAALFGLLAAATTQFIPGLAAFHLRQAARQQPVPIPAQIQPKNE